MIFSRVYFSGGEAPMKKLFCFITVLCFVLCSCAAPAPPLSYQNGLVRATFDVTLGGEEFTLCAVPSENAVEVVRPECLSGVRLVRKTAKFSLIADGEEMELPSELLVLSEPLFEMFSLSEANVENADKLGERKIKTGNGVFTVELSENGAPDSISFEGARNFTARNISLEHADDGK